MLSQPKETARSQYSKGRLGIGSMRGRPSPNGRDLRILLRILGSVVLAQTLFAKRNEPARNANTLLVSICLARLTLGRLANVFGGEFVHLSDLVCVICLIA
jgi:hypothetical protein